MGYHLGIRQAGVMVAEVEGPSLYEAMREILHYAQQYIQDGPIEIVNIKGTAENAPPAVTALLEVE